MISSSSSRRRIIESPFIKLGNKSWHLTPPKTLSRPISPPPSTSTNPQTLPIHPPEQLTPRYLPGTAEVEAGAALPADQLSFWCTKLLASTQPPIPNTPRLPIPQFSALYSSHAGNPSGSHFVIHQHDHPIAGIHYDLRLQCNRTSSTSFAIMYGLPGDPNSLHLNRNATETRVHCLWNHLIETASLSTGSMLIWDTGFYEVLPSESSSSNTTDPDSESSHYEDATKQIPTEQQKLHRAFAQRKLRIRLHGTRLPPSYTISLRLTKENDRSEQPGPPSRKRKRRPPKTVGRLARRAADSASDPDSDADTDTDTDTPADMGPFGGGRVKRSLTSLVRHETPPPQRGGGVETPTSSDMKNVDPVDSDNEGDDQEEIRRSNAYPGAINDIGSIHQRTWYLSMDRLASGFVPAKDIAGRRVWSRRAGSDGKLRGFERFHVLGRAVERSVVTGRLAGEVLEGEGVVGFVPRGLWNEVEE